jgi:hypothetical protein
MKTIAISLFLLLALSSWAFAECTTVYRSS